MSSIQVSTANDVKVYNISTGKSLPEWISERKRRSLIKNDEGLRRRIELIQDFKMPTAATLVQTSPDRQYIFAAGVYKPRVRCYDTSQLSMKFERCVESEVVAMKILSDDYSKFVLLESDRKVEFHVQHGFYYSTRIPTFGRDLSYHSSSCDLYIASSSSEMYRLNLEQGQFLSSLETRGKGCNVCVMCDEHSLLTGGMENGTVECFDPRSRNRVGLLPAFNDNSPPITALQFDGPLTLGVGTYTGQVLLYDIRTSRPFGVKEHQYQLPIKSIHFQSIDDGLVLSSDSKGLRIWNKNTCKPFTTIETEYDINCVCPVKDSGLIFMAVEHNQLLSYFVPSLGPAPRWCSFLDNLTEELEETPHSAIYDDYKFVTPQELNELGLSHLIGTNILRAYMHGYFMDIRLYQKAQVIAKPFAYQEYRQKKIKEKIEEGRANRVQTKKLPKVNRELAMKLMAPVKDRDREESIKEKKKSKKKLETNALTDNRFSSLFTNPDFQVDTESIEYKVLNPILSQAMKLQDKTLAEQEEEEEELSLTDDESNYMIKPPTTTTTTVTEQHTSIPPPSTITLLAGDIQPSRHTQSQLQLGKRLDNTVETPPINDTPTTSSSLGDHQVTFIIKKKKAEMTKQYQNAHKAERKLIRRSASEIIPKRKQAVYWQGRRIK